MEVISLYTEKLITNTMTLVARDVKYEDISEKGIAKFYAVFDEEIVEDNNTSFHKMNLQSIYNINDFHFCVLCERLLNKACQLECGCRSCYECLTKYLRDGANSCPNNECDGFKIERVLRDKAYDRETSQLLYKCVNKECNYQVSLLDFYEHRQHCRYSFLRCRTCLSIVQVADKSKHNLEECTPVSSIGDNDDEISGIGDTFISDQNQVYPDGQETVVAMIKEMLITVKEELECQKMKLKKTWDKQLKREEESMMLENRVETIGIALLDVERLFTNRFMSSYLTQGRFNEYIWRISDFERKSERTKRTSPSFISSPSFITSDLGYKICLKLYPGGDGKGKGAYLSLYMVILRGKYDSLLRWPFPKVFTISMINPKTKRNKSLTLRPDSKADSYQRPTENMNPGIGDAKFIKQSTFYADKYLCDESLFIRFKLES